MLCFPAVIRAKRVYFAMFIPPGALAIMICWPFSPCSLAAVLTDGFLSMLMKLLCEKVTGKVYEQQITYIFMKDALRVVGNTLLSQIGHLVKSSYRLDVDLLLLCLCGLNLAVISRALLRTSLSLVLERLESLFAPVFVFFELVSVSDDVSEESSFAVMLVALVILRPTLGRLKVLAVLSLFCEISGRPMLLLGDFA